MEGWANKSVRGRGGCCHVSALAREKGVLADLGSCPRGESQQSCTEFVLSSGSRMGCVPPPKHRETSVELPGAPLAHAHDFGGAGSKWREACSCRTPLPSLVCPYRPFPLPPPSPMPAPLPTENPDPGCHPTLQKTNLPHCLPRIPLLTFHLRLPLRTPIHFGIPGGAEGPVFSQPKP